MNPISREGLGDPGGTRRSIVYDRGFLPVAQGNGLQRRWIGCRLGRNRASHRQGEMYQTSGERVG